MAQRANAIPSRQDEQQSFPATNHLMPGNLKTIPTWFQSGPFNYNLRLMIGFLPGAFLIFTVTGKIMLTYTLLGVLATMLFRSSGLGFVSMFMSLAHLFILELVNVYSMVPLVWHSVLNAPLFAVFHVFIAVSGFWWCIQDEEFRRQDPRFVLLVERAIFYVYPFSVVTMVTWVGGMLFGRYALALTLCLVGLMVISLYLVPLQSSFTKPQTPTNVGLIQHRFVVWLFMVLQLCVPPVLYTAVNYNGSLHSILVLSLLMSVSPFLLTLLEAQGLFYWTSLGPKAVNIIRWSAGCLVLFLLSVLLYADHTSYLSALLVPTLFTQFGLISLASSDDHTHVSVPSLVLTIALGVLYTTAFYLLPWAISHNLSFLSLPLSLVQVLLWCLAMTTVVMAAIWKRTTLHLLVIYNFVFVFCEYLLHSDGVYPASVSMVTTTTAAVMFWRLYSIKEMSANSSVLNISLHLTKLCLLLPSSHLNTLTSSTLVTVMAVFIISYTVLHVAVFDQPDQTSSSKLLVYAGLLSVGLILSVESILSPVWAAATHQFPSGASLMAVILTAVGVFLICGMGLIRDRDDQPHPLTYLPRGLLVMATLIGFLQPEFNLSELLESFSITVSDASLVSEDMYLAAWDNLLTWVTLYTSVFALVLLVYVSPLTIVATCFLGVLAGFIVAISAVHSPPYSALGMLYASILGVGGAILGRAFIASKESKSPVDVLLIFVLMVCFVVCYFTEWKELPKVYLPWKPFLDYFALPCTKIFATVSLTLGVAFRMKMYFINGQPYLPVAGNLFCVFFFLFAILNPFHQQLEVSVLLSSCIFLLAQPDNLLLPKTSTIFLAPSLILSVSVLYILSASRIIPVMIAVAKEDQTLLLVGRVVELALLAGTVPGQSLFLYYLWTGKQRKLSIVEIIFYIMPSAFLPQMSSTSASALLGSIGVFSFCLLIVGDYTNIKLL